MSKFLSFSCLALLQFVSFSINAQVQFEEIHDQLGVNHMYKSTSYLGGGVAVFDFDNDGWEDIYLTGGENSDKLLRNLGNWQFQDVSFSSGIASFSPSGSFGVVTGDIDNDGYRDILITTDMGYRSKLLHNQGNGTFVSLPNAFNDGTSWKTAASFGDVNADGLLDFYIGAYVYDIEFIFDQNNVIIGFQHRCSPNYLFINNGDLTFTDASLVYGVADTGCALATAFTDFDGDLDMDLILGNDFGAWVVPSTLFQNQLPLEDLEDVGTQTNMNFEIYGMGIAVGDIDKDADLDYYQTNLGRNILSLNEGGVFMDITTEADVESDSIGLQLNTGWGCFFFDANNDSWPDLFVGNGEIAAAAIIDNADLDSNRLYLNNGDLTFTDITADAGLGSVLRARGAAYADFDKDGKLDFVVQNIHRYQDSTHFEVYRNASSEVGNWIGFRLIGVQSNRDAFGAHVRLVQNGVSTIAEVDGGSSHASQNSSIIHFGLGSATLVDSVIVTFPSGIQRAFSDLSVNQVLEVVEDITIGVSSNDLGDMRFVYEDGIPTIISSASQFATIQLLDVTGRSVLRTRKQLVQGQNPLQDISTLPVGVYLLEVSKQNDRQVFRIVVSR
jgi:hypothetical protein